MTDALTVLRDAIDEVEEMKPRMRGRERNAVGCVAVVLRERLARLEREQAEAKQEGHCHVGDIGKMTGCLAHRTGDCFCDCEGCS